jgi:hypothetical protein
MFLKGFEQFKGKMDKPICILVFFKKILLRSGLDIDLSKTKHCKAISGS